MPTLATDQVCCPMWVNAIHATSSATHASNAPAGSAKSSRVEMTMASAIASPKASLLNRCIVSLENPLLGGVAAEGSRGGSSSAPQDPPQLLWRLPLPGGEYFHRTWCRDTAKNSSGSAPYKTEVGKTSF